jgi:hypothetical protein
VVTVCISLTSSARLRGPVALGRPPDEPTRRSGRRHSLLDPFSERIERRRSGLSSFPPDSSFGVQLRSLSADLSSSWHAQPQPVTVFMPTIERPGPRCLLAPRCTIPPSLTGASTCRSLLTIYSGRECFFRISRALPRWTPENRPYVDTSKPANDASQDTSIYNLNAGI